MKMNPKLSVVIPVYQAERTINRCLNSIVSQISEGSGVEMILIDDGSSDQSGELCREYADRYSFVRYFFKENGGVSSARNMGIQQSLGEYILFVDSDDYVSEDYFKAVENEVSSSDWDLIEFSFYYTDGNTIEERQKKPFESRLKPEVISKVSESICRNRINSPCGKVFKRNIVDEHHINFTNGAFLGEDWAFNIKYALHIQTMKIVNHPIYFVCVENSNSLSRRLVEDTGHQGRITRADVMGAFEACELEGADQETIRAALTFTQYRSVYTRAKMLIRLGYDRKTRISMLRALCKTTRKNGTGIPQNRYCYLIAAPVILGLPGVIDAAAIKMTRQ